MRYAVGFIAAAVGIFLLSQPQLAAEAVGNAVSDCLEVIVPSLFAFSVLSAYLTKSGLHRIILRPLAFPLSKLLRIDEELCGIFLLSNLGGYPVGASLISDMLSQGRISRDDAARLLCFCYGSGPSFIIGIAGMRVFQSSAAGLALFASCFLGSVVNAVVVRISGGEIALSKGGGREYRLGADCFIDSVMAAARVMLTVCAMITAFSVMTAMPGFIGLDSLSQSLFSLLGAGDAADKLLPAILEVTQIKSIPPVGFAMPLCAALLSFGGVCVVMQVTALARGIPLKKFLLSRISAAAVSAAFAAVLSRAVPVSAAEVLAANAVQTEMFSHGAALSACVLIMCGILLSGEGRRRLR